MDEHICGSHRVHKVIADKAAWAIPDEAVHLRYNASSGHDTVGYIASAESYEAGSSHELTTRQ